MPTVVELSAPYENHLVPILPVGPGVCQMCHTDILSAVAGDLCYQCSVAARRLAHHPDEIGIIALAADTGQLARELLGYKNAPSAYARQTFQMRLAALLWRWLATHEECMQRAVGLARPFSVVTTIPSTRPERTGPHPLRTMVGEVVGATSYRYRDLLQPRVEEDAERRLPSAGRFTVSRPVVGSESILLIDDTWTSGANAYSAVQALRAGGAGTVAVLAIGRWFRTSRPPDYQGSADSYYERARGRGWDWNRCYRDP